jgi:hypothetical protein
VRRDVLYPLACDAVKFRHASKGGGGCCAADPPPPIQIKIKKKKKKSFCRHDDIILKIPLTMRLEGLQRWSGWFGKEENLLPVAENRTRGDHSSDADGPGFLVPQPLKIKALCSLEMSAKTNQATHCRIPECLEHKP